MKTLSQLLQNIEYLELINFIESEIKSISYDSRLVNSDGLFVALRGTKIDAHNFIPNVINSGCKIIVCEEVPNLDLDATFIKVASTRKALAEISHWWFERPTKKMKIIGVTGTNGKTTSTFILAQILEKLGYKVGIIGTTGIYFANRRYEATHTTPESFELCKIFAEMIHSGVQYVSMEVSSHALDQYRVYGIDFDGAIFTNLSHDHLDYHKTMDNYAKAKKILFDTLKEDSFAIVQGDDNYSNFILSETKSKFKAKVGRGSFNDYIISNEIIKTDGLNFDLVYRNEIINIVTNLIGKFNIDNTALAAVLCLEMGFDKDKVISAIKSIEPAEGRMAAIKLRSGATGIVDYAHTPDALEKALLTCRQILEINENNGHLICVFGCGGDRDRTKRPKMGHIAAYIADLVVITDDNPRTEPAEQIRQEILQGVPDNLKHKVVEIADRAEAIRYSIEQSKEGDILIVAGKGHEKYQIIGKNRFYFDDFEQLKQG